MNQKQLYHVLRTLGFENKGKISGIYEKIIKLNNADDINGMKDLATELQGEEKSDKIKLPQGINKDIFETTSILITETIGDLSDDVVVQGSRASGTAKENSDIDYAIRVPNEKFDELIRQFFKTPNPGSANERTMLKAIETGKIQSGEAKLRKLRIQLENLLGIEVDISIILKDGPFDNGSNIKLHKE